jgi:flagellar basal-body rod protein FlgF
VDRITHDGRFELQSNGRLDLMGQNFPILGENGQIFLPTKEVVVDEKGVIAHNGEIIDAFRVEAVKDTKDLQSFNQAIFHLNHEHANDPSKYVEPNYTVMQGYVEDSSVTKAYIGLVPEWKSGFEANLKTVKAYIRNMSSSVQMASPQ